MRESWGLCSSHCRAKETLSRLVSRIMFVSRGAGISGLLCRCTRGVSPCLEWKQRTLLSSRIATGISCSPLSGLKGDKPPVEFGERTRDCSPSHAGKEGPHLTMTGASRRFSRPGAPVWDFSRGMTGSSGSLSCGTREVKSPCAWRGETCHCSRVMVGE